MVPSLGSNEWQGEFLDSVVAAGSLAVYGDALVIVPARLKILESQEKSVKMAIATGKLISVVMPSEQAIPLESPATLLDGN